MRLLIFLLFFPGFLYSQTQIGDDIDGILPGDHAGSAVSVSANGSIVALGSPKVVGNESGQVRVFENISNEWIQVGASINGDVIADHFGSSVSLSSDGSILAIGGPNIDSTDTETGYVRVFENNSGIWTQIGNDINGDAVGDKFGLFVSLSGDGSRLAISGYACCGILHGFPSNGKTRIYDNIGGDWIQIGEEIDTQFKGISDIELSTDGSVLAISSPSGGAGGFSNYFSGGVKVYESISGEWMQIGETYVASSGFLWTDHIGGIGLNDNGSILLIAGSTYMKAFENIQGNWEQQGATIETEIWRAKDLSISNDGTILAISSYASGLDSSLTRIYSNSSGTWAQSGIDIYEEAMSNIDALSSELSDDGVTLIVGAPYNDDYGTDAGQARVYGLTGLVSLKESELISIMLYPNPAKDQFTLTLPQSQTLEMVNLYDTFGQLIQTSKRYNVDTSQLASGLYHVEVITDSGKATEKLIIE